MRALKNGKAAGPDGIIGEFFKHSATCVVPFLVKFFNRLSKCEMSKLVGAGRKCQDGATV